MVTSNEEKILQEIATLKAEVTYLKERDKAQNGTIQRVDEKVDGLKTWIMGVMAGVLASIFVSLVNLGK